MLFTKKRREEYGKIKAIFFDVDGVLISLPKSRIIPRQIILKSFSNDDLMNSFGSLEKVPDFVWETENLRKELFTKFPLVNLLEEDDVFLRFATEYFIFNLENKNIQQVFEIKKVIPILATCFTLAIVTNNVCVSVRTYLNDLLHHFQGIKTWECMPEKPDIQGFSGLCQELGFRTDEILFVGDSYDDIETANNAGAWSCAASWDTPILGSSYEKIHQKNKDNSTFLGFLNNFDDIIRLLFYEY